MQWVAPIDGQAGGTWMGVNAYGVVACLLNAYLPEDMPPRSSTTPPVSRGAIIPALLTRGTGSCALVWMNEQFEPSSYEPFWLVVAWPEGAFRWLWSGTEYVECSPCQDEWTLVSSSYWNAAAVLAWRGAHRFADE